MYITYMYIIDHTDHITHPYMMANELAHANGNKQHDFMQSSLTKVLGVSLLLSLQVDQTVAHPELCAAHGALWDLH